MTLKRTVFAFFIAVFFAGCNLADNGFGISPEKEMELGDMMVEQSLTSDPNVKFVTNPVLDSAVKIMTDRLFQNLPQKTFTYKFRIIQSEDLNAFTMPGGNIFIYTGLIKFTDTPEELAAVLAHEIGHAEERHVVGKIIKEIGIGLVFTLIAGDNAALLTQIGHTMASTVFDRSQEKEADDFAFDLLEKSSINPTALAGFFIKMNKLQGGDGAAPEILMTHPSNEKRIKAAKGYKVKKGFEVKPLPLDWKRIQAAAK
jgi:predicted Zn-dependent protease